MTRARDKIRRLDHRKSLVPPQFLIHLRFSIVDQKCRQGLFHGCRTIPIQIKVIPDHDILSSREQETIVLVVGGIRRVHAPHLCHGSTRNPSHGCGPMTPQTQKLSISRQDATRKGFIPSGVSFQTLYHQGSRTLVQPFMRLVIVWQIDHPPRVGRKQIDSISGFDGGLNRSFVIWVTTRLFDGHDLLLLWIVGLVSFFAPRRWLFLRGTSVVGT
mmetsp:Transcript_38085/g.79185  ORF Transcript_38085/g.79185 Transcript_38085/m.79185 type:complete len:215 (-) Transcript_38085:1263-1907(-)